MRTARLTLLVLSGMSLISTSVWPKFGVIKSHARFVMYHPPGFHAYGREIHLEVDSADLRAGLMMVPRIQRFLQDGLERQDFKLAPDARTVLQCTLTDATAFLETVTRSESVNVRVGEHEEEEKEGKKRHVEDCRTQTAPVTYIVSSGHLAMQVRAKDAQTRTLLMNQLVEHVYRQESPIAGPPRCHGETYGVLGGQLQDSLAILSQLGDEAGTDALALAAGYDEPREVMLAVDDELKPGNAQAEAGGWQEALNTWTNTSVHSSATEAARQYNLGVGHEALAALAMRNWELNDAGSHLDRSQECYAQALKLDPQEKYFRDTVARVQIDGQLLQLQVQQAAEEASARPDSAPDPTPRKPAPAATSVLTIPLESWPSGDPDPVHDYRVYVRTRLSAQRGRPAEALKQELLASAADYQVQPGVAAQVLDSETRRLAVVQQNTEKYREDFQAAAASGTITAEERQMLRKRQRILHLSDEQVKQIESQFRFQETN